MFMYKAKTAYALHEAFRKPEFAKLFSVTEVEIKRKKHSMSNELMYKDRTFHFNKARQDGGQFVQNYEIYTFFLTMKTKTIVASCSLSENVFVS